MISVEIKETPTFWIGTVTGFADGPISPKTLRGVLQDAFIEAQLDHKPLIDVLNAREVKALKAAEKETVKSVNLPELIVFRTPKPHPWKQATPRQDPNGVRAAFDALRKEQWPNSYGIIEAENLEDFTSKFLERVRGYIVDYSAMHGRVLYPENRTVELWTVPVICAVGDNLRKREGKKEGTLRLKNFLAFAWEPLRLHTLTREELALVVNHTLGIKDKPDALWKTAYRLGLLSSRANGPKERGLGQTKF